MAGGRRKLQSHSKQRLGFDLWMRMVQCSSACPDSRQGFEPFPPNFQEKNNHSMLKLSSLPLLLTISWS